MKHISLIILLFLSIACKKEESRTSFFLVAEKPAMMGDTSAVLKGIIIAVPNDVNIIDHGFRVSKFNANPKGATTATGLRIAGAASPTVFSDTTISLGHRKTGGRFDFKFNNLEPGIYYYYYAYATDQFQHTYISKSDSAISYPYILL